MNKTVTIENWDINFDDNTARFSIEDDNENASIIVDVILEKFEDTNSPVCAIDRVVDCWLVPDENQRPTKTKISNNEVDMINAILADEYKQYKEY